MSDQKNLIIAIAASVAILLGFQLFVEKPKQDRLREQQAVEQAQNPSNVPAPAAGLPQLPGLSEQAGRTESRDKALAQAPRVKIEGKRLVGSINLTGGRIDDIVLPEYKETIQPDSQPPVNGPATVPNNVMLVVTPYAMPRFSSVTNREIRALLVGIRPPINRPAAIRVAANARTVVVKAVSPNINAVPNVNAIKIRRCPTRSPNRPAAIEEIAAATPASASIIPVMVATYASGPAIALMYSGTSGATIISPNWIRKLINAIGSNPGIWVTANRLAKNGSCFFTASVRGGSCT